VKDITHKEKNTYGKEKETVINVIRKRKIK
jgi:hypothetical protein